MAKQCHLVATEVFIWLQHWLLGLLSSYSLLAEARWLSAHNVYSTKLASDFAWCTFWFFGPETPLHSQPPAPSPQPPALCFYREAPTRGSSVETAKSHTQNWGQIPAQRLSWEKGRKLRIPWPLFLLWRCGELQAVAKYPCGTIVQKPDSLLFWD